MHYVAIRDNSDLAGTEMERRIVGGTEPGSDRKMVWACTTYAGALYWARERLRQYGCGTTMHVYEAVLDDATVTADPNYDCQPSSVMAGHGVFGRLVATFHDGAAVEDALAHVRGEDDFVDSMLGDQR